MNIIPVKKCKCGNPDCKVPQGKIQVWSVLEMDFPPNPYDPKKFIDNLLWENTILGQDIHRWVLEEVEKHDKKFYLKIKKLRGGKK